MAYRLPKGRGIQMDCGILDIRNSAPGGQPIKLASFRRQPTGTECARIDASPTARKFGAYEAEQRWPGIHWPAEVNH